MRAFYTLVSKIGSRFFRVKRYDEPHFIAKRIEAGEIKKILLIQLQQLGDTLVFTPAAKALLEKHPNLQIDLLCNAVSYEVYKKAPNVHRFYVDEFWFWGKGKRKLSLLLFLLFQIRREKYDLAILDAEQVALKYPIIAFLTGARYRLGYDVESRGFLNNVVPPFPPSLNLVLRNKAILEFMGVPVPSTHLWLPTAPEDRTAAQAILREFGSPSFPIVIHQGSNFSSKHWFKENWVRLSQKLLENPNVVLFFTGAGRERKQVEAIVSELKSPRAVSLVGKTTIHVLKELIELASLFITVDTGVMHVGKSANAPMVVLMSARDYEDMWIEPSERVTVIRKDVECKYCFGIDCPTGTKECMKLITVEEVYQAALSFLPELASA
ncbi:MAG: glycosyltransferase family 9 protein [Chloroherpetonaceae bacterium]|nr:glycosyltransferase family 9 protein [Chloroherpetonaceae bacterium]MDW8436502.1 glycosyltransferase family 9 protein [Chloroherpetonaceae bacterium]